MKREIVITRLTIYTYYFFLAELLRKKYNLISIYSGFPGFRAIGLVWSGLSRYAVAMAEADTLIPKGTRPGVAIARQAFLYGQGDGKRVLEVERLAAIGEVHQATIRRWMPEWLKEYETILSGTTETGLSLALSAETLRKHEKDVMFYRNLADELALEIKELPKLEARIHEILVMFRDSPDPAHYDTALALFKAFLATSSSRKALITQHLAVSNRWKSSVGIDGLQDVAVTREKAMATGRAKLRLASEAREQGTGDPATDAAPATRGRIFRRGDAPAVTLEMEDDGLGSDP